MSVVPLTQPQDRWLDQIHRNYLVKEIEALQARLRDRTEGKNTCRHCQKTRRTRTYKTCGCGQTEEVCDKCLDALFQDINKEKREYTEEVHMTMEMYRKAHAFCEQTREKLAKQKVVRAEGCQS